MSLGSSNNSVVEPELKDLSITRQCELLKINRSSHYYKPKKISNRDLEILYSIDKIYTAHASYGYRFIHKQLQEYGYKIGKNRVLKYMRLLGIQSILPKKKKITSVRDSEHKVYPYLLKEFYNDKKQIVALRPNHIWSGDITYINTSKGFMYLAVILDWYSRSVLSWKLSNTIDADLTVAVLEDAIRKYGKPEIFNSDQGCQYTSNKHINVLNSNNIKISMNGKGRSIDNIVVERFFRTLKYEDIYSNHYKSIKELRRGLSEYMDFYNYKRFHSSHGYKTPMWAYKQESKIAA